MNYLSLLTICVSLILGACGVASIFVAGWVKSSHLAELRATTENQIKDIRSYADIQHKDLRTDINKLWEKVSKVEVLSSKLDAMEKGIDEIKELIKEQKRI